MVLCVLVDDVLVVVYWEVYGNVCEEDSVWCDSEVNDVIDEMTLVASRKGIIVKYALL